MHLSIEGSSSDDLPPVVLMEILGTLHVCSQLSASSLSWRWHSTQVLTLKQEGKQNQQKVSFSAQTLWFHGASISDTATTEESQCCSLIRVFPRLHTLFITLLLYNSDIKWHWP